jgi:DNA-directed RNA polymerase specialized sigma24 family protein
VRDALLPLLRYGIARPDLKKHWSPSEAAFRRLLRWLDGSVDSAGERYLEMRRRLVAYFDRRGCRSPDDLADETLDRVSRRLEEEGAIEDDAPGRYCYIVAKFVFLEYVRREGREAAGGMAEVASAPEPPSTDDERLVCLDRCLGELAATDRELILEYYGLGQPNPERRRALAARLGLSPNALAIRACRIRDRLEVCVRACGDRS